MSTPPRPPIRLVACDADGTLLDDDSMVSDRTRRTLDAVRSMGVEVVLATGRPYEIAGHIIETAGIERFAVCSNGAVTVDAATGERLRVELVDPDLTRDFLVALRAVVPGVGYAVELESAVVHEEGFGELVIDVPADAGVVDDATEHIDEFVEKALIFHGEIETPALLDTCAAFIAANERFAELEVTRSGLAFVEAGARGVSKATALAAICDDLGIGADEVVAFGDQDNDVAMLEWAGIGVAMANADPGILGSVNTTTLSNVDHGVAAWLEEHLLSEN